MTIETYIELVSNKSIQASANSLGHVSYAYAMGYMESSMIKTLKDLNLSKEQLKILQANINILKD